VSGRTIAGPGYPGDDGSADPAAAAALAAYAAGQGSEHAALTALAGTRLLVPVVAVLTGSGEVPGRQHGALRRDKTSEMALPVLVGKDGRRAVIAFTGMAALQRWRADARPVPVAAAQVWQAGLTEAEAVVVDVAGPVPLAVEGARLAALAAGTAVPEPHQDPDLLAAVHDAAGREPLIGGASLGPGQAGTDLSLAVTLSAGCAPADPAAREAIQRLAGSVAAAAGGRLRRGLEVAVAAAGAP
jgi:hypothetical protein